MKIKHSSLYLIKAYGLWQLVGFLGDDGEGVGLDKPSKKLCK